MSRVEMSAEYSDLEKRLLQRLLPWMIAIWAVTTLVFVVGMLVIMRL